MTLGRLMLGSLLMQYLSKAVNSEQLIVNSAKLKTLAAHCSLFTIHYSLLL